MLPSIKKKTIHICNDESRSKAIQMKVSGQKREFEPMLKTKDLIAEKINWRRKENLAQHPRDIIKKQITSGLALNHS